MYDRILVLIDGSAASEAGLSEGLRLARLSGGRMRVMHFVDDLPFIPAARAHGTPAYEPTAPAHARGAVFLERARARAARAGVEVDTVMVEGVGARLADFVNQQVETWKAEIVVLGTQGRRGLGNVLLGGDAEDVIRHVRVPALLVHWETDPPSTDRALATERTVAVAAVD